MMHPLTLWPSGLRRWLKAPFRKGVGSNPTGVSLRLCSWLLAHCAICVPLIYSLAGPHTMLAPILATAALWPRPGTICLLGQSLPAMRRPTYLVKAGSDCASTRCRHDQVQWRSGREVQGGGSRHHSVRAWARTPQMSVCGPAAGCRPTAQLCATHLLTW